MAKVLFDTSALIPVVIDQLERHETALHRFTQERDQGATLCCSTHTLAECYAVMTALPLPKRISATEASHLLEANFIQGLTVIDLTSEDYARAIQLCASKHRISGQIYDALHIVAALKEGCETAYTYNLDHFESLADGKIRVALP